MELKKHNRYDYSPIIERPDYDWPDGKRLAVHFALNIEHFSFGEGLGHTPTNPGTQPDVRNYAWRDYGLRVGIWRVFYEPTRLSQQEDLPFATVWAEVSMNRGLRVWVGSVGAISDGGRGTRAVWSGC